MSGTIETTFPSSFQLAEPGESNAESRIAIQNFLPGVGSYNDVAAAGIVYPNLRELHRAIDFSIARQLRAQGSARFGMDAGVTLDSAIDGQATIVTDGLAGVDESKVESRATPSIEQHQIDAAHPPTTSAAHLPTTSTIAYATASALTGIDNGLHLSVARVETDERLSVSDEIHRRAGRECHLECRAERPHPLNAQSSSLLASVDASRL